MKYPAQIVFFLVLLAVGLGVYRDYGISSDEPTSRINGAVTLKWKCANPAGTSGTIYQVWRRDTPTGDFNYLGGTGSKSFDDATIPAGSGGVTYQIQAVRSTAVGLWAQFNVNFGVSSGGEMTASVVSAPKIAA